MEPGNSTGAGISSTGQHARVSVIHDNPMYDWGQDAHPVKAGATLGTQPPCPAWSPSRDDHRVVNVTTAHGQSLDPVEAFLQALLPTHPKLMKRLRWSLWATNALVIGHVVLTGYCDPLPSSDPILLILLTCLQVLMLLLILLAFFVLTSHTLYVRLGRYDRYLSVFCPLYLTFALELLAMLAAKGYFIVLVVEHTPYGAIWGQPGYLPLWTAHRFMLCAFWIVTAYSTFQALEHRHYDPEYLVHGIAEDEPNPDRKRQQM